MITPHVGRGGIAGGRGSCMDARGIAESELIKGTRRSSLEKWASWSVEADKLLVFRGQRRAALTWYSVAQVTSRPFSLPCCTCTSWPSSFCGVPASCAVARGPSSRSNSCLLPA